MSRYQQPRRIETTLATFNRRSAPKPDAGKGHIYISKKSDLKREAERIERLLNNEMDEVTIHGMGASLCLALSLAQRVEHQMKGSIEKGIRTSTVTVQDDIFPLSDEAEMGVRSRPLSAVHIRLYRPHH